MNITKHTIRRLVLEELKVLRENEIASTKSLAIQAMKKLQSSKIAMSALSALAEGGDPAKHEFLSELANLLKVDLGAAVSKLKTQQTKMGGVPGEEEVTEQKQQVTET